MRPRRDIDDLDESLFTRDEAIRRRLERADMIAAGQERLRQEAVANAAAKARWLAYTQEGHRQMVLREYEVRGLTPPSGALVSLALLIRLGWQIQDDPEGGRMLVAPPPPEKYVAKGECS